MVSFFLISISGKAQYSYAQVDSMLSNIKLDDSVRKYYENTNKAELEITKSNWIESAKNFRTAFSYHESNSAFDFMLYMTVALEKSNDSATIVNFLADSKKYNNASYPVDSFLNNFSGFAPHLKDLPFYKNLHFVLDTVKSYPESYLNKIQNDSKINQLLYNYLSSSEETNC